MSARYSPVLRTGFIILALLAVGWLVLAWRGDADDGPPGQIEAAAGVPPVPVRVAPVERGRIRDVQRFAGTLYPVAQFEVAPRIGGMLEHLYVDLGDEVRRGQEIARLDDDEYQQQVEEARAATAVANATLAEARSTLEARRRELARTRQLREQKIAAAAELDTAEAEVVAQEARQRLAEAQVRQAEAALRGAKVRLAYTSIRADWQDEDEYRVVGERFVDEGTTIAANAPIVSVLDIRELTGVVFVTERVYPKLRVGQRAVVMVEAHPGREFEGTIARIAPMFREASRQARVEIRIPNPEAALKPGMFVAVRVELAVYEDATLVPIDALVERDGTSGVFTIDRDAATARFVAVESGVVEGERAALETPELTGEVVILGQHLLEDGRRIVVAEDAAGTL